MKKGEARKQHILEQLADHVLLHGLQATSLRPMAAAVGTSDRMLLHYFADKEALLTETLTLIAQRLMTLLEQAHADPMPFQRLLPVLSTMLKDVRVQPYMRLWLELIAFAAREKEPYRTIARDISGAFLAWIAAALSVDDEKNRKPLAALTLAIVESFVMFDALGDTSTAESVLAATALEHAFSQGMISPAACETERQDEA